MSTGLRERKKAATRAALHRAALELVAVRGLDGVVVDDIAEVVGVSPRTFFNYFSTKDEAVLGFDADELGELAAQVAARPAEESPVQAVRAVARTQAEGMAGDVDLWRLRMRVVDTHPVLLARLMAAFGHSEQAMAAVVAGRTGGDPHDLYPQLLAGAAAAALRSALHHWLTTDFAAELPALVDEAWTSLAAGLPVPSA
ncbi:TetR family transcriptional regulator [Klenkia sp. LSe6-5]|uniref:TetR family transcriptional regulator n=1 Tax=Klenkia sesuvii TaxID=3103137 RepID=A0ABU8DQW0_9ACTN